MINFVELFEISNWPQTINIMICGSGLEKMIEIKFFFDFVCWADRDY